VADHRFPLSFREVEELMLERGVSVWCAKFGRAVRKRAAPSASPARGQVAPGRDLHKDQRQAEVPVAGHRPAQDGTEPPGQDCGRAFLPWPSEEDPHGAPGWSSPTSSAPTARSTARSCPPSSTALTRAWAACRARDPGRDRAGLVHPPPATGRPAPALPARPTSRHEPRPVG